MAQIHIPDGTTEFPASYALRVHGGAMGQAALDLSRAVYEETQLSVREMEAARVRTALINGCMVCKQARAVRDFDTHLPTNATPFRRSMHERGQVPDDAFYAAIGEWRSATIFSDRERLAIELAERMGESPQSMQGDDAFWDLIHAVYSDREIVDLTISIGSWIGMGRMMHTLELDTVCMTGPEALEAA